MTVNQARTRLILSSIICIGAVFIFFAIAPVVGFYSLAGVEWRIPQLLIPVFVGYVASASHFLFNPGRDVSLTSSTETLLSTILYGSFGLFIFCSVALMFSFYLSNAPNALSNTGHSIDWLANGFTILLSILTASTSIISSYIFSTGTLEDTRDVTPQKLSS